MTETFKPSDDILKELVAARRDVLVRLQKSKADQLKDLDSRGQARVAALRKILPKDMVAVLDSLDKMDQEESAASKAHFESVRTKHTTSVPSREHPTPAHPGLAGSHLVVASGAVGWFLPYYSVLHASDGTIFRQSYNTFNIDEGIGVSGTGSGQFGSGGNYRNWIMDWWFRYNAPYDGSYNHTICLPEYGSYSLFADDGFGTSKEAHASINLSAQGWQFNYRDTSNSNVLDVDSQNINVTDVALPGSHSMYYYDLLIAGEAFLRVSASYYVYARGDGSNALINLVNPDIFVYVPWVYIE